MTATSFEPASQNVRRARVPYRVPLKSGDGVGGTGGGFSNQACYPTHDDRRKRLGQGLPVVMMHGAAIDTSQKVPDATISVAQQSADVRVEVFAGVQPTPPQTPHPSTQLRAYTRDVVARQTMNAWEFGYKVNSHM